MRKTIKSEYPRIYKIWQGMRQRCNNPNDKDYMLYGGRSIKVCPEWDCDAEPFILWSLKNGYDDNLSIDRINTNGDYCPENCRWATATQQIRNRRIQRTNKTGVNGVHIDRNAYRATIYVNNKRIDLGRYKTLDEAAEARKQGELIYW